MPVGQVAKREWRTYYVVFQKSKYHRPWNCFTWNGWQHTWVFFAKYQGPPGLLTPQHTIKVEPLATFLDVDYWADSPENVAKEFINEQKIKDIVKIMLPLPKTVSYNIRGLINCVTLVKSVMGLSKWFVMTPQQLHRYLLRIGGKSLKNG